MFMTGHPPVVERCKKFINVELSKIMLNIIGDVGCSVKNEDESKDKSKTSLFLQKDFQLVLIKEQKYRMENHPLPLYESVNLFNL
jgi:hypothetical protein